MGMTVTFDKYLYLGTSVLIAEGKGKIVHFSSKKYSCIVANFADKKLYVVPIENIKILEF